MIRTYLLCVSCTVGYSSSSRWIDADDDDAAIEKLGPVWPMVVGTGVYTVCTASSLLL